MAFNFGLRTQNNASASRLVGVFHALQAVDVGSCGEVGRGNVAHQALGVDVGIVDVGTAAVDDLAQVVRRHIRGHTHGNTVSAVHQQVGHFRGHHARLQKRVVEVVHHIHGVLVEVVHDVLAHLREAALRVSHGSCRVAVDRAEVTLPIHERVAHIPVLRHAHQRAIDAAVAVRVILTEHLTHHAGTFLIRFVTGVAQTLHAVENTAMHGLEAVAHVGQRTSYNHRHTVVDVRGFHLLLDVDFNNSVIVNGLHTVEILVFVHIIFNS